jgi:putative competence-damage inducible protein
VALASQTDVEVLELHLARTRNDNREFAVQYGWNLLRKYLLKQVRTK